MTTPKYRPAGSSITTPVENIKRKEIRITQPALYSQQIDLSDFIGMNPDTGKAITSMPYEFRRQSGEILQKGKTDELADTDRVFTRAPENIVLYVGEGEWKLSIDCKHEFQG
jgi:hypothetical protein